jgi:hypothetical protein
MGKQRTTPAFNLLPHGYGHGIARLDFAIQYRLLHHLGNTVILPVVFITYSLAYLDRANFGFGAAGGMATDLHLTSSMSSLLGVGSPDGWLWTKMTDAAASRMMRE